jgi:hypothetical protein
MLKTARCKPGGFFISSSACCVWSVVLRGLFVSTTLIDVNGSPSKEPASLLPENPVFSGKGDGSCGTSAFTPLAPDTGWHAAESMEGNEF